MAVRGFGFVGKTIDILNQTQDKINRQFLKRIEALESKAGTDESDISDLKTETAKIGDLTSATPKDGTVAKRLKTIDNEIGDLTAENPAEGTIAARLKALEAANQ